MTAIFKDGTKPEGIIFSSEPTKFGQASARAPCEHPRHWRARDLRRIPMSEAVKFVPKQAREDVFTVAIDSNKMFLGLGPLPFPTRPDLGLLN